MSVNFDTPVRSNLGFHARSALGVRDGRGIGWTVVGSVDISAYTSLPWSVSVFDADNVYIGHEGSDNSNMIHVDTSDKTNPTITGDTDLGTNNTISGNFAVAKTYLGSDYLIGRGYFRAVSIDVTTRDAPTVADTVGMLISDNGGIQDLGANCCFDGDPNDSDKAYVVYDTQGGTSDETSVEEIDIANPTNIQTSFLAQYSGVHGNVIGVADISGVTNQYIGDVITGGLDSIDSAYADAKPAGFDFGPWVVTDTGGHLAIVDRDETLFVYDLSSESTVGELELPGASYHGIESVGNRLFLARGDGDVDEIDLSDPANPALRITHTLGVTPSPTSFFMRMMTDAAEEYLFYAAEGTFYVIDIRE